VFIVNWRILLFGTDTKSKKLQKNQGEIMNICMVSTFDGTTDDFMEIFNWAKDQMSESATDMEVGVIREGKVITMGKINDMEKFQQIMTSEEMRAWDTKHNCVDVVYSLEQQ